MRVFLFLLGEEGGAAPRRRRSLTLTVAAVAGHEGQRSLTDSVIAAGSSRSREGEGVGRRADEEGRQEVLGRDGYPHVFLSPSCLVGYRSKNCFGIPPPQRVYGLTEENGRKTDAFV